MFDIGVNLAHNRFNDDRAEVLARAKDAGVKGMLITGTSVADSKRALALCQQHSNLWCTAGVHPHDAEHADENFIAELTALAAHEQVKAIGECGLDFNRNFSTPEAQIRVFQQQILLAAELQLPLFLHQRDAFDTWTTLLAPYLDSVPAMVSHCFTGNTAEVSRCLDAGMYIGITGWLCDPKRGQELRDAVRHIPLDRLLIETDAPFLTPKNIKPKPKSSRNEPAYLSYVVATLAELLPYSAEEIIQATTENAKRVFALPL